MSNSPLDVLHLKYVRDMPLDHQVASHIPGSTETFCINPLSAGDAFKCIHTVFPQLKFDRN